MTHSCCVELFKRESNSNSSSTASVKKDKTSSSKKHSTRRLKDNEFPRNQFPEDKNLCFQWLWAVPQHRRRPRRYRWTRQGLPPSVETPWHSEKIYSWGVPYESSIAQAIKVKKARDISYVPKETPRYKKEESNLWRKPLNGECK